MICRKCQQPFPHQQRTKPRFYCDRCQVLVDREQARIRDERRRRRCGVTKREPKPKLIRFAGFDRNERKWSLDGHRD